MSLNTNITNLQEVLNKVNTLPSAENLEDELNSQSALILEQNAKIAELADILADKASGSSGQDIKYDTCTISIYPSGGKLLGYCATCFDGKNTSYKYKSSVTNLGNVTITDVICGSVFSIICEAPTGGTIGTTHLEAIYTNTTKGAAFIPRTPGASATINITASGNGGGSN